MKMKEQNLQSHYRHRYAGVLLIIIGTTGMKVETKEVKE